MLLCSGVVWQPTLPFYIGRVGMSTNSALRRSSGIPMTRACLSPAPLTRPWKCGTQKHWRLFSLPFYDTHTHTQSPRWQALSCARVTLASLLPQRSRKGQKRTNYYFLSLPHKHKLDARNYSYCFYNFHAIGCLCVGMCIVCLHMQVLCKQALVCVRACPLAESMPAWYTLTDGDREAFILAGEFAL